MKAKLSLLLVCIVLASGCKRYERTEEEATMPAPVVVTRGLGVFTGRYVKC